MNNKPIFGQTTAPSDPQDEFDIGDMDGWSRAQTARAVRWHMASDNRDVVVGIVTCLHERAAQWEERYRRLLRNLS